MGLPATLSGSVSDALPRSVASLLAALAQFSSETRLYDLDIDDFSAPIAVEGFTSREALSEISSLELLALTTDALIDLDALLWKPVRVWLTYADGQRHARSGFIRKAEALEADGGLARYRLSIVPWLWLCTQQTHSRIFQNQRLPEILAEVFNAYATHANWQLAEGVQTFLEALPPRTVCSQYRETDYAFVSRLLAEEGLGFFFEEPDAATSSPGDQSQRMTIFCDSTRFEEDSSSRSSLGGAGIRFHRADSQEDQDAVQTLHAVRNLPSAMLTTASWDPIAKRVVAASLASVGGAGGSNTLVSPPERYHWAGHGARVTPVEIERSNRLALEAIEAEHKRFEGTASVRSFRPGHFFALTNSPHDQANHFRAADRSTLAADERTRFTLSAVNALGLNNLPADLSTAIETLMGRSAASALQAFTEGAGDLGSAALTSNRIALSSLEEAAKAQGFACSFHCLRSLVPWRPFEAGQRRGARAEGPQSAIVVGAENTEGGSEEMHRDAQGRIQVRFHWQRGETAQDRSSGWVRIAQRYAGSGSGMSFIPRIGQEVLVGFIDEDIDQPIVLGALYNGRGERGDAFQQAADRRASAQGNTAGGQSPAWHGASPELDGHRNAAGLTGFKTQGFGGSGYSQLQFDDHDGELRVQLASTQAASAMNLGHLIHTADNHRGSQRGSGFELRTDQSLAVRGGLGVLLTTWHEVPPGGGAQPIGEITGPLALLAQARGLSEAFDDASRTHHTVGLSVRQGSSKANASALSEHAAPMPALLKVATAKVDADEEGKAIADAAQSLEGSGSSSAGAIPHLGAPMVVAAGRAGLALVAGQAIQIATQDSMLMATGGDLNLASGQQLTLHSGQAIGVLAGAAKAGEKGAGLTAIAAQGPIEIQAQSDALNIDSEKALTIVSANAEAVFAAAVSIRLVTAGGASIEIEGGNITVQCPGTLTVHAAQHQFTGPTQLSREMNAWPETKFDEKFQLVNRDGTPAKDYRYEITREDGAAIRGVTDSQGWTTLQKSMTLESLSIDLLGPASEESTT